MSCSLQPPRAWPATPRARASTQPLPTLVGPLGELWWDRARASLSLLAQGWGGGGVWCSCPRRVLALLFPVGVEPEILGLSLVME